MDKEIGTKGFPLLDDWPDLSDEFPTLLFDFEELEEGGSDGEL